MELIIDREDLWFFKMKAFKLGESSMSKTIWKDPIRMICFEVIPSDINKAFAKTEKTKIANF